jgi:hypothetical protein
VFAIETDLFSTVEKDGEKKRSFLGRFKID